MTPLKRYKGINRQSKKREAEIEDEKIIRQQLCERAGGQFFSDGRNFRCLGGLCELCNKPPDFKDGHGRLHLSHTKSKAQLGKTTMENCQMLCRKCHNTERHGIKEVDSEPHWSKNGNGNQAQ